MARLQAFIIVALLVSFAFATPIRQPEKRSFKIPRYPNPNYRPNGPRAYKRALNKFGFNGIAFNPNGEVASLLKSTTSLETTGSDQAAAGSEDGATPAQGSQNDAQFLSPVTVGGQTFIMNFDSGSSDTWVFNTNLASNQQGNHNIYDPTKSSTFQDSLQGSSFQVTYGDGSFVSGPVGVEQIDIGGSTVAQQAIGLPNNVSASFSEDPTSDGLVGLAFSQLNTIQPQQQKTFFDNVAPDLSQPVFTAQLLEGQVGAYEFGQIDTSAFQGQLTQVPVDSSQGFWEVDSATAQVNGQSIDIADGTAILDTGTSLMLVPDEMLMGYYNQVPNAELNQQVGGVIFPCNQDMPDLNVAIGDSYMATIPGSGIAFAEVGTDSQTGENFCFGGVQSNQGIPFAIYGDVFFKSQFVAFDQTGPSVGVAPHA